MHLHDPAGILKEPVIIEYSFLFPIQQQQEAKYHTAKVCEMGHAVGRARDTRHELEYKVSDNKPLGLDRHGDKEDILSLIHI